MDTTSGRARDEALAKVRRLTTGVALTVVGSVAVAAGYVAHAAPGHHVSAVTTVRSSNQSSSSAGTGTPSSRTSAMPGTTSSGGLAPPTTSPQYSRSSPQVVSGSS